MQTKQCQHSWVKRTPDSLAHDMICEHCGVHAMMNKLSETKQGHTPTPWHWHNAGNISIIFKKNTHIVDCGTAANATFIVKAVNCHDELVEALKIALDIIDGKIEHNVWADNKIQQAVKKAS